MNNLKSKIECYGQIERVLEQMRLNKLNQDFATANDALTWAFKRQIDLEAELTLWKEVLKRIEKLDNNSITGGA